MEIVMKTLKFYGMLLIVMFGFFFGDFLAAFMR
jgi:hypothetical protein